MSRADHRTGDGAQIILARYHQSIHVQLLRTAENTEIILACGERALLTPRQMPMVVDVSACLRHEYTPLSGYSLHTHHETPPEWIAPANHSCRSPGHHARLAVAVLFRSHKSLPIKIDRVESFHNSQALRGYLKFARKQRESLAIR